jgi:hypothetical protein
VEVMTSNEVVMCLVAAAIAYSFGVGSGKRSAEQDSGKYLSSLESKFLRSENLPALCETKWNEAKTYLQDEYDDEINSMPERDDPRYVP